MIYLSPAAASEIKRLKLKQQQPSLLFRLAVKFGGCSGLYYDMSFDTQKVGDRLFEQSGIQLVIDQQSSDYLSGLTLDYSEDLMGGGFRFHNPQAIANCGCGNSFSISQ